MDSLFLTYYLSILAKNKGFDEPCICFYKNNDDKRHLHAVDQHWGNSLTGISKSTGYSIDDLTMSPTYDQFIHWLMYKHKIYVLIEPYAKFGKQEWHYSLIRLKIDFWGDKEGYNPIIINNDEYHSTYNEARIKAIERALNYI